MNYRPTYDETPHVAYVRPGDPQPKNYQRAAPTTDNTIVDTSSADIEPFYDYQIQPQPVYLVSENVKPFVVRNTYASYNIGTDPMKIVNNAYNKHRTVMITNVGTDPVYLTDSENDTLFATRYQLDGSGSPNTITLHTTQPVYCYAPTPGIVSIVEEWQEET